MPFRSEPGQDDAGHIPPVVADLLDDRSPYVARVLGGEPLHDVLEDLVLEIEKRAEHGLLVSVLLLDEMRLRLLHAAAPSLPDAYNRAIDGVEIGPRVGSCGTAAFTGRPVYVTDIATDPLWADYRDLALRHDLRACWSIPILLDKRVIGTFAIYYRYPCSPIESDRVLINRAASTVSGLIEASRRS